MSRSRFPRLDGSALPLCFLALVAGAGREARAQAIEQETVAPVGGLPSQHFGRGLAVDGDLMVVGGAGVVSPHLERGAVWVYRWDPVAAEWEFEAALESSTPVNNGFFGDCVAIHGDVIAVGAINEDSPSATAAGAVHVFRGGRAVGGTWVHEQKLTASAGATIDKFGHSLAVHGDWIVVGAPWSTSSKGADSGQVHVYEYDSVGQVWNEGAPLLDPDGTSYDYAGSGVAFDGTTLAVGCPGEEGPVLGTNQGAVSLWTLGPSGFTFALELLAAAPQNEQLGEAVAIDGIDLIVGAPARDDATKMDCGAVHFFTLRAGTWQPSGTHSNPDPWSFEGFGREVALKGKVALASVRTINEAYSFRKGKGLQGWFLDQELGASNKAVDDEYGTSVAVGDHHLLVGAPLREGPGASDYGAVYRFDAAEINLSITPLQPTPGQTMSVSVYDGRPNDVVLLIVDELDGVPTWIEIALSTFGPDHRFEFDVDAASPLLGVEVGVTAFKLSPTGPVVASQRVLVDL